MVLGITGGLGCGKSTAARLFEKRGYLHLDSDALVREKVLTAKPVRAALRERYGDAVFGGQGEVNRVALAERVFADDGERIWLEGLTHPVLFDLWREALRREEKAPRWIIEAPLLFEAGLENWFDFTVCVACSPEQQMVRLEQRGMSRGLAGQRISKQLPLARKIELSDYVLWNEGSAEFLGAQVDRLADSLAG